MPQSPELAGGVGFTFEDLVAARYLAALLSEASAPGNDRAVVSGIALQQRNFGEPLDDIIVDFRLPNTRAARLSLQVKRTLVISSAASNSDFREIIRDSLATLKKAGFRDGLDRYGAAVGTIAAVTFRDVTALCELARASVTVEHFEARFATGGNASAGQRAVRDDIAKLLSEQTGSPCPADLLHRFLKHFLFVHFDYLHEGAIDSAAAIDSVRPALCDPDGGEAPKLWATLCKIAREGAGRSQQFSRASLVGMVSRSFRLSGAPSLRADLAKLATLARRWVLDIDDDIRGTRLQRTRLSTQLDTVLARDRFIQVRGLAGSGKSALLRRRIEADLARGSVLFLKSDRLEGRSWSSFATAHGLECAELVTLLVELEAVGTSILYIDGIDRIEKQHRPLVSDVVRAIIREPLLANWRIVVSLRDAGAEPVRTWLPDLFEAGGIGTVDVQQLDDAESHELSGARPELKRLLFGPPAVREIVRRLFFAKILSQGLSAQSGDPSFAPRSEIDLIENWWARGGFDASVPAVITKRQRAIVELGAKRVRSLNQPMALAELSSATLEVIDDLVNDGILQVVKRGHSIRFAHDIFFEWAYFHRLIDFRNRWPDEIKVAGEPPVVGRVIELLSQSEFLSGELWPTTLAMLDNSGMRSQWTRAWLLGPLSAPNFDDNQSRFYDTCAADGLRLLRKALVWFQAEKTVPNPSILDARYPELGRDEIIRIADLLGWPADFEAWRRFLVLLLDRLDNIPVSVIPDVVVLFEVWQNALADFPNTISTRLLLQSAAWLNDIEKRQHSRFRRKEDDTGSRWSGIGSDVRDLEQSLRRLVLRAARAEPALVTNYLTDLLRDDNRIDAVYREVIGFAPILAQTHAVLLVELTLRHLKEELPQTRLEREQEERRLSAERRKRARAKPASERTRQEEMEANGLFSVLGSSFNSFEWDTLAVDRDTTNYFPASPLREPFHSLFASAPTEALRLVKNLTNHAMAAWRELHHIDPQRRVTPIPIELEFPWGHQTFWGTRREYLWYRGLWAPKPLACAYLALDNWAFGQLEAGRTDLTGPFCTKRCERK